MRCPYRCCRYPHHHRGYPRRRRCLLSQEVASPSPWNAALGAAAFRGDRARALQLLEEMQWRGVAPAGAAYSAAAWACARSADAGAYRDAVDLLGDMRRRGLKPDEA